MAAAADAAAAAVTRPPPFLAQPNKIELFISRIKEK